MVPLVALLGDLVGSLILLFMREFLVWFQLGFGKNLYFEFGEAFEIDFFLKIPFCSFSKHSFNSLVETYAHLTVRESRHIAPRKTWPI